jgi:nucleoside-diphosphate-sugar epimerase
MLEVMKQMPAMKALVTGGNGFLGRYIVEQLLQRGHEVRVVGRGAYPELEAMGVACWRADLGAGEEFTPAARGCDVLFHVAARAGIWGPWEAFYRSNVAATEHVVRTALRAGVPKLVYTSSPSVVFGEHDLEGVDERQPFPQTYLAPYPHTKAIAERYVLAQEQLLTTALRPHLIWGPRDPHILPRLLARARAGRLRQVGDGTNRVDVIYVENAAAAHLLAAEALSADSPARGRAYFIAQEPPVLLWDFIGELLRRAGAPPVRGRISYPAARRAAALLERTYTLLRLPGEPPMTRLLAAQLAMSHWFDTSAARRDLGYTPQISTEEGLRRLVASLK